MKLQKAIVVVEKGNLSKLLAYASFNPSQSFDDMGCPKGLKAAILMEKHGKRRLESRL